MKKGLPQLSYSLNLSFNDNSSNASTSTINNLQYIKINKDNTIQTNSVCPSTLVSTAVPRAVQQVLTHYGIKPKKPVVADVSSTKNSLANTWEEVGAENDGTFSDFERIKQDLRLNSTALPKISSRQTEKLIPKNDCGVTNRKTGITKNKKNVERTKGRKRKRLESNRVQEESRQYKHLNKSSNSQFYDNCDDTSENSKEYKYGKGIINNIENNCHEIKQSDAHHIRNNERLSLSKHLGSEHKNIKRKRKNKNDDRIIRTYMESEDIDEKIVKKQKYSSNLSEIMQNHVKYNHKKQKKIQNIEDTQNANDTINNQIENKNHPEANYVDEQIIKPRRNQEGALNNVERRNDNSKLEDKVQIKIHSILEIKNETLRKLESKQVNKTVNDNLNDGEQKTFQNINTSCNGNYFLVDEVQPAIQSTVEYVYEKERKSDQANQRRAIEVLGGNFNDSENKISLISDNCLEKQKESNHINKDVSKGNLADEDSILVGELPEQIKTKERKSKKKEMQIPKREDYDTSHICDTECNHMNKWKVNMIEKDTEEINGKNNSDVNDEIENFNSTEANFINEKIVNPKRKQEDVLKNEERSNDNSKLKIEVQIKDETLKKVEKKQINDFEKVNDDNLNDGKQKTVENIYTPHNENLIVNDKVQPEVQSMSEHVNAKERKSDQVNERREIKIQVEDCSKFNDKDEKNENTTSAVSANHLQEYKKSNDVSKDISKGNLHDSNLDVQVKKVKNIGINFSGDEGKNNDNCDINNKIVNENCSKAIYINKKIIKENEPKSKERSDKHLKLEDEAQIKIHSLFEFKDETWKNVESKHLNEVDEVNDDNLNNEEQKTLPNIHTPCNKNLILIDKVLPKLQSTSVYITKEKKTKSVQSNERREIEMKGENNSNFDDKNRKHENKTSPVSDNHLEEYKKSNDVNKDISIENLRDSSLDHQTENETNIGTNVNGNEVKNNDDGEMNNEIVDGNSSTANYVHKKIGKSKRKHEDVLQSKASCNKHTKLENEAQIKIQSLLEYKTDKVVPEIQSTSEYVTREKETKSDQVNKSREIEIQGGNKLSLEDKDEENENNTFLVSDKNLEKQEKSNYVNKDISKENLYDLHLDNQENEINIGIHFNSGEEEKNMEEKGRKKIEAEADDSTLVGPLTEQMKTKKKKSKKTKKDLQPRKREDHGISHTCDQMRDENNTTICPEVEALEDNSKTTISKEIQEEQTNKQDCNQLANRKRNPKETKLETNKSMKRTIFLETKAENNLQFKVHNVENENITLHETILENNEDGETVLKKVKKKEQVIQEEFKYEHVSNSDTEVEQSPTLNYSSPISKCRKNKSILIQRILREKMIDILRSPRCENSEQQNNLDNPTYPTKILPINNSDNSDKDETFIRKRKKFKKLCDIKDEDVLDVSNCEQVSHSKEIIQDSQFVYNLILSNTGTDKKSTKIKRKKESSFEYENEKITKSRTVKPKLKQSDNAYEIEEEKSESDNIDKREVTCSNKGKKKSVGKSKQKGSLEEKTEISIKENQSQFNKRKGIMLGTENINFQKEGIEKNHASADNELNCEETENKATGKGKLEKKIISTKSNENKYKNNKQMKSKSQIQLDDSISNILAAQLESFFNASESKENAYSNNEMNRNETSYQIVDTKNNDVKILGDIEPKKDDNVKLRKDSKSISQYDSSEEQDEEEDHVDWDEDFEEDPELEYKEMQSYMSPSTSISKNSVKHFKSSSKGIKSNSASTKNKIFIVSDDDSDTQLSESECEEMQSSVKLPQKTISKDSNQLKVNNDAKAHSLGKYNDQTIVNDDDMDIELVEQEELKFKSSGGNHSLQFYSPSKQNKKTITASDDDMELELEEDPEVEYQQMQSYTKSPQRSVCEESKNVNEGVKSNSDANNSLLLSISKRNDKVDADVDDRDLKSSVKSVKKRTSEHFDQFEDSNEDINSNSSSEIIFFHSQSIRKQNNETITSDDDNMDKELPDTLVKLKHKEVKSSVKSPKQRISRISGQNSEELNEDVKSNSSSGIATLSSHSLKKQNSDVNSGSDDINRKKLAQKMECIKVQSYVKSPQKTKCSENIDKVISSNSTVRNQMRSNSISKQINETNIASDNDDMDIEPLGEDLEMKYRKIHNQILSREISRLGLDTSNCGEYFRDSISSSSRNNKSSTAKSDVLSQKIDDKIHQSRNDNREIGVQNKKSGSKYKQPLTPRKGPVEGKPRLKNQEEHYRFFPQQSSSPTSTGRSNILFMNEDMNSPLSKGIKSSPIKMNATFNELSILDINTQNLTHEHDAYKIDESIFELQDESIINKNETPRYSDCNIKIIQIQTDNETFVPNEFKARTEINITDTEPHFEVENDFTIDGKDKAESYINTFIAQSKTIMEMKSEVDEFANMTAGQVPAQLQTRTPEIPRDNTPQRETSQKITKDEVQNKPSKKRERKSVAKKNQSKSSDNIQKKRKKISESKNEKVQKKKQVHVSQNVPKTKDILSFFRKENDSNVAQKKDSLHDDKTADIGLNNISSNMDETNSPEIMINGEICNDELNEELDVSEIFNLELASNSSYGEKSYTFADILSQSHTNRLEKEFEDILEENPKSKAHNNVNLEDDDIDDLSSNNSSDTDDIPSPSKTIKNNSSKIDISSTKASEVKKMKKKAIKLIRQSKSIWEIHEKLNIETKHDLEQRICNLVIQNPHPVLRIHKIATNIISPLTEQQRRTLEKEGIELKLGYFSDSEDKLLKKNWRNFCKLHSWDKNDYLPFVNSSKRSKHGVLSDEQILPFVQFLSHGFENRTMNQIYRRFRKMFCDKYRENGKFSKEDDKIILEYIKTNKSRKHYADISTILKRSQKSIMRRYHLLKMREDLQLSKIEWTKDLGEKLLVNLTEVTCTVNLSELKNRAITSGEWSQVAERMRLPAGAIKRSWFLNFYPRFFTPTYNEDIGHINEKIIDIVSSKYSEWNEINWKTVSNELDVDFPAMKCSKILRDLVRSRVPSNIRSNLKKALRYLKGKNLLPRKDGFTFVNDILEETKNGTILPRIK